MLRLITVVIVVCFLLPLPGSAEEDLKSRLPRIAATEADKALDTFTIKDGFTMQLLASEPNVADPVALDFDARGRLYVAEMRGYSEQAGDLLGRIRLLEDTTGDGRFDKSTIYAQGLSWPTAVLCYDGGVFIAAGPDLLFLKDTTGDGKADLKKRIITGFARSNVQGLVNSLRWGLDNRVHGATSSSGGTLQVVAGDKPGKPINARGRDFSFDPVALDLRLESGGGQHGMCFDDWGRKFVCSNSNHLQLIMFEDRYLGRNAQLSAPSPRLLIAADGPAADVFRTSPVEPWRIVRTELRVAGKVPGPIEGGGRPAGYFTAATGVTIYRGDAWPTDQHGIAIIGDVGSNLIHRKRLEPEGLGLIGRRIDVKSELVTSRDVWFRPVQYINAPDGTLVVADMYRETIEHPHSLPPNIKKHLDLTSGRNRGRIYRLAPSGFKQPKVPDLQRTSTQELIVTLSHTNAWHRQTAARLLFERQDPAAVKPLVQLLGASKNPLARLHALYVLDGLGGLSEEIILARLSDESAQVRQHAVRLSERLLAGSPAVRQQLYKMTADSAAHVRYQLAFTLGQTGTAASTAALARLAASDASDGWSRLAILSSSGGRQGELFTLLAEDGRWRAEKAGRAMLSTLAHQVGLGGRADQVALVVQASGKLDASLKKASVAALSDGLSKARSPLLAKLQSDGQTGRLLAALQQQAIDTAGDEDRPLPQRIEAIATLAIAPYDQVGKLLASLLDSQQPRQVQTVALRSLGRFKEPDVARTVIAAWPSLSPSIRREATELLFARKQRLEILLDAISRGDIKPRNFDSSRLSLVLSHPDPAIRRRAKAVLGDVPQGQRGKVVEQYQAVLQLSGDPTRGKVAFKKTCAACHRLQNVGHVVGQDLATIRNKGPTAILLAMLDPNREVNPQYLNYTLITTDGLTVTGMIAAETASSVTLLRADGASDTIQRTDIDQFRDTGMSLMPEGLEKQLSREEIADLIAYLMSIR